MNSSDFFRVHWFRHLCCKALVKSIRQSHVQPTSPSICIEGTSSLITLSPTLVDPALVSVIRVVDGQDTGFSAQPAEQPTLDLHRPGFHLQSALVQASVFLKHQPTGQLKRTRPQTSYPVSQSCVLLTKSRSWSRVVTNQKGRKCILQNSHLL